MQTGTVVVAFGIASLLSLVAGTHGAHAAIKQMARFGYSGSNGPAKWGKLSPLYSICSTGKGQSPVDIFKGDVVHDPNLHSLDRDYVPANATLIDNGFNLMVKYGGGAGSVTVEGRKYALKQMHWHTPSEHTMDGERFAAELQLLHVSKDGRIAGVAILYRYGKADPFLSKLKKEMGQLREQARACTDDEEAHVGAGLVDTKSMRRATRKYYRYVGSLTTPPCTENVVWSILGKVRQISKEQVEALTAALPAECRRNARPVQPLNGRKVSLYREDASSPSD